MRHRLAFAVPLLAGLTVSLPPAARADENAFSAARAEVRARTAGLLQACAAMTELRSPVGLVPTEQGLHSPSGSPFPLLEHDTCEAVRDPHKVRVVATVLYGLLWALALGTGIGGVVLLAQGLYRRFGTPYRSLYHRSP